MALKFSIDASKIASQFKDFLREVERDIQQAVGELAAQTHAKVVEMASKELNSTQREFMDSLSFEEILPGVWVVSVDEGGLWIEEGIPAGKDMKPDLLREGAETSKSGNRYKVIPFDYGKRPSQMSAQTRQLVDYLKQNLRKEKVPFKKIERNSDGSPKIGKLHEFDFGNPGGRLAPPGGKGNTPIFKNLTVYQSLSKATGKPRRDIMTFRTVSSGPGSEGKWIHPGLDAKKFLDRALDWATQEWENKILPEILKKWE